MYRIKLATSNFYYVQRNNRGHWSKTGGYHASLRDARQLVEDMKRQDDVPFTDEMLRARVVAYC